VYPTLHTLAEGGDHHAAAGIQTAAYSFASGSPSDSMSLCVLARKVMGDKVPCGVAVGSVFDWFPGQSFPMLKAPKKMVNIDSRNSGQRFPGA